MLPLVLTAKFRASLRIVSGTSDKTGLLHVARKLARDDDVYCYYARGTALLESIKVGRTKRST